MAKKFLIKKRFKYKAKSGKHVLVERFIDGEPNVTSLPAEALEVAKRAKAIEEIETAQQAPQAQQALEIKEVKNVLHAE